MLSLFALGFPPRESTLLFPGKWLTAVQVPIPTCARFMPVFRTRLPQRKYISFQWLATDSRWYYRHTRLPLQRKAHTMNGKFIRWVSDCSYLA
jgi:hypothetical protein